MIFPKLDGYQITGRFLPLATTIIECLPRDRQLWPPNSAVRPFYSASKSMSKSRSTSKSTCVKWFKVTL